MPKAAPETLSFRSLLGEYRGVFEAEAERFLGEKRREAAREAGPAVALVDAVSELVLAGGKRLRPALVHFGCLAAGDRHQVSTLAVALAAELLHTYLLIHDDIMDHAELRRGRPTAHQRFSQLHRTAGWAGDADHYGRSMAILAGDLAASFAFELAANGSTSAPVSRCFAAMAQEVIHGQYLEVLVTFAEAPTEEELTRVLRLKSGRYSVERPLELGALLGGANPATVAGLKAVGQALGEAFQLRDDLLGMLGDENAVGKPVGGDWAEGKFTFLTYHAINAASAEDRELLTSRRGAGELDAADLERVVSVLKSTGAVTKVEAMIHQRLELARGGLARLTLAEPGASFLAGLVDFLEESGP